MNWHILLTSPRAEFAVAGFMIGRNIRVYCPTYQVVKRRGASAKRVKVDMPMFPGYLFVAASDATAKATYEAAGCRGYLSGPDGPKTISDAAIDGVRKIEEELKESHNCKSSVRRFYPGDMVRLSSAPDYHSFKGLEALVQKLDRHDRAILCCMLHGRSWLIVSPAHWLEPVSQSA